MNEKLPISCFIIAQDEADRIGKTIQSVKELVDEIIVIDSGSTDGTQKAAEEMGCKVFFNKWNGFGPQKRFGEDCSKNKWLLNLDADEYGFQSQTQRQNTQIETLKAERRLDQVRETTENAVKNAIRMFDNATSVARLESENAEVSRQRFQKMDELFELGKASSLELREAQLAWLAAENGKSSAQFQAVNAQIALFQLMGSITSDGALSVGAND